MRPIDPAGRQERESTAGEVLTEVYMERRDAEKRLEVDRDPDEPDR